MLDPQYRYVALDFETTWLQRDKDSIIQVGVVEFDVAWNTIESFQSLVRPSVIPKNIKDIVGYLTGITTADLEQAPWRDEVYPKIAHFFDSKTILIGHNIGFDRDFLCRYSPDVEISDMIDTFPLAQSLVHFAPSYALEVLIGFLYKKNEITELSAAIHGSGYDPTNAHDALHDSKDAAILFFYCIRQLQTIHSKYPWLHTIWSQMEQGVWSKIIKRWVHSQIPQTIPTLSKSSWSSINLGKQKDSIMLTESPNQERYNIGWMTIKEFVERIASQKNIIISFSHRQKLEITKNILEDMGVSNIGYLRDSQQISTQRFHGFLNKKSFTQAEWLFVCKYFSHAHKNHGFIHLLHADDYRIFYFLREQWQKSQNSIILTTHGWLYSYLQSKDTLYDDYAIVFCDVDRRYASYNNFMSRSFDIYYMLWFLDKLLYTYDLCIQTTTQKIKREEKRERVQWLYNSLQVFFGILWMETKHFFTGNNASQIQLDPILTHPQFPKTQALYAQLEEYRSQAQDILGEQVHDGLIDYINQLQTALTTVILAEKRLYSQTGEFYFVYKHAVRYTNWDEFTENFDRNHTVFFSTTKGTEISARVKYTKPLIRKVHGYEQAYKTICAGRENHIFILSVQKKISQEMFAYLYKQWIHKTHTVVAENITWWTGKNVFLLQQWDKTISIWWYMFLLDLINKKKSIDKVINLFIKWSLEQQILTDICWYGSQNIFSQSPEGSKVS